MNVTQTHGTQGHGSCAVWVPRAHGPCGRAARGGGLVLKCRGRPLGTVQNRPGARQSRTTLPPDLLVPPRQFDASFLLSIHLPLLVLEKRVLTVTDMKGTAWGHPSTGLRGGCVGTDGSHTRGELSSRPALCSRCCTPDSNVLSCADRAITLR